MVRLQPGEPLRCLFVGFFACSATMRSSLAIIASTQQVVL